jgi:microcystin-dependent protein
MMKVRGRFAAAILSVCLAYLNSGSFATAGTLLPNGMQYFTDANGLPLSAGCVYFYTPGTLVPKATYTDSSQTISNTNPVQLDAAGRAIIYGTGTYRQIVKATGPNASTPCSPAGSQIWDQITASTDSSATIFAGASAGTPNAITVTAAAFSGADGQVINYISTNTNTGGATFNPSGFGAVQIVRDSSTGPAALTGGELVATNAVSLIYDATASTFHILSPVNWPNSSGVPVGTIINVAGFTAPANYALTYGQPVSRTTYSSLFSALTLSQTGTITSGSPTITALSSVEQLGAGMPVEALGIPAGTTITGCSAPTCTMSANATASRSGQIVFFAFGDGDGSTTFNLPDYRGLVLVGRSNMGGADPGNMTTAYYSSDPAVLGHVGGGQSSTLTTPNLPPYTPAGTSSLSVTSSSSSIITGAIAGSQTAATGGGTGVATGSGFATGSIVSTGVATLTGTTQGGTSTPFSRVQPSRIVNFAIRLTQ